MHVNVNSLQNKLEEVNILMNDFKAQIIFLTETKIDSTYPSSQFRIEGYNIYRIKIVLKAEAEGWLTSHQVFQQRRLNFQRNSQLLKLWLLN